MEGRSAGERENGTPLLLLSLTALGVVFGDIGTSPLYAVREAFFGEFGIAPTRANILGVLSLIFWALVLVISIKYLAFILRADNRGEGGEIALMALVHPEHGGLRRKSTRGRLALILTGLFGAALLYGDGMITPAISVLSAVEGLEIVTPVFAPYILPITVVILLGLFLLQRRGTSGVGLLFGPVTLAWFLVLALLGVRSIVNAPEVLAAVSPLHGIRFLLTNEIHGFLVLGAVFLVVTGGEALYADMGHFGRRPIRITWFALVLPSLLLNYFGQGALLLVDPEAAHNPFYRLAPSWALIPLVVLATMATIIASQAVISGAFSLTRQAVHLGYSPRLRIDHTSPFEIGQVYIPEINWMLMVATIGLVLGFGSSSALAGAYGVAVSTTMVITTILFFVVARERWRWGLPVAGGLALAFLVVDLSFWGANITKIAQGGWFPLVVAGLAFTLMTTWRRGRKVLAERMRQSRLPIERFLERLHENPPVRVSGTAVYLTGNPEATPSALIQNLHHSKVLHERVAILNVHTEEAAYVSHANRVDMEFVGEGIHRIVARYGFMEDPDVPEVMALARERGFVFDAADVTYFLGRERLIASREPGGMAFWREILFAFMARNASQATAYFQIPQDQVIEVGAQIRL